MQRTPSSTSETATRGVGAGDSAMSPWRKRAEKRRTLPSDHGPEGADGPGGQFPQEHVREEEVAGHQPPPVGAGPARVVEAPGVGDRTRPVNATLFEHSHRTIRIWNREIEQCDRTALYQARQLIWPNSDDRPWLASHTRSKPAATAGRNNRVSKVYRYLINRSKMIVHRSYDDWSY